MGLRVSSIRWRWPFPLKVRQCVQVEIRWLISTRRDPYTLHNLEILYMEGVWFLDNCGTHNKHSYHGCIRFANDGDIRNRGSSLRTLAFPQFSSARLR